MAKKIKDFSHESLQDKEAIANYLKAVMKGFKKGEIVLSDDEDELTLTPETLAKLKIKAEQSKKSQSLSIKISWSSDTESSIDDTPLFIDANKTK
ncbi:MAG: amphi-Trp domain-containing protein [Thiomicrorhabdus chilensis]|uniref:amphi-Trp domain-containing protein n=1 Tax=Thiomicrorhabdus chilensis TaxID=63656 RepID=UPI0003FE4CB6|nr:amphi-Trp domain-containing protein [Thiomicrorhabdus chilensis]MDX1347707.1 amphi-Trp domain-containing protein [Thiomicrorhabdus chilensis]